LDSSDLDGAYNLARHALYELLNSDAERIENIGGWLATATNGRAGRRLRIDRSGPAVAGVRDDGKRRRT
jgi:hypothetical protein